MYVPCIRLNKKRWEELEPVLKSFGYITDCVSEDFLRYPYLILNYKGEIGLCSNVRKITSSSKFTRYIVDDIQKFIRSAKNLIEGNWAGLPADFKNTSGKKAVNTMSAHDFIVMLINKIEKDNTIIEMTPEVKNAIEVVKNKIKTGEI